MIKIYENQTTWAESDNALDIFVGYAKGLKLNVEKFKESVTSNKYANKINQDQQDGYALNVNTTPTFFINGKKIEGADLKTTIDSLIK